MSQMLGMDVSGVRSLATQLDQKASEIDSIVSTISGVLDSTQWVGLDATRFRSDWTGQHTSQLRQVADALRQTANLARTNASEQEQASN